jgi:HAD superfamily hydrolase (TIGR01509 family)
MCNEMFTTANPDLWPRACVFDCDGLLIASNGVWDDAFRAVAREVGREDRLNLGGLVGASVDTAAWVLSRQLGLSVSRELVYDQLAAAFARRPPRAMPGAQTLVERACEHTRLAVASNGPPGLVGEALRATGLLDYFTAVVCAESVGRPKPAPDVYLHACRQVAVDPSDAIGLEDSLVGARAAAAAGLLVVGVGVRGRARMLVDVAATSLSDPVLLTFLGLDRSAGSHRAAAPPHA